MLRTMNWFVSLWIGLFRSMPDMKKAMGFHEAEAMDKRDEIVNRVIGPWAKNVLKKSGNTIVVKGQENIPKDQSVLFVSNHQSNFDIPILLGHIDKPKAFIAKIELKKFPIINKWMTLMECVFIDRNDIRQSAKAIGTGVKNLKKGYSMVIFPEGTRSNDGSLLEFKPGALKLATKSGVPIVPVTINGSKDIMKKGQFIIRPAHVEVIISEPVQMRDEWKKDTIELTEHVKGIIESKLTIQN